jgi:hypothetical protein
MSRQVGVVVAISIIPWAVGQITARPILGGLNHEYWVISFLVGTVRAPLKIGAPPILSVPREGHTPVLSYIHSGPPLFLNSITRRRLRAGLSWAQGR